MTEAATAARIEVEGAVQGVGFRPLVARWAQSLGLVGRVFNHPGGAAIEVEGPKGAVLRFESQLRGPLPPPAQIDLLKLTWLPLHGWSRFEIVPSRHTGEVRARVLADLAPCEDCVRELFDPLDRRYRYPFLNCTACGPRYSILLGLPYDRAQTTMRHFPLCADCAREYSDPLDRRYHAQPVACSVCGPQLRSLEGEEPNAQECQSDGALKRAVECLTAGKVVAVKGVGGFHLMCRADSEAAVNALRTFKRRHHKPLAVLVSHNTQAESLCELSDAELAVLGGASAPIVVARSRATALVAPQVSEGLPWLGVMLPQSPLQHLISRELGVPLVATSGNVSGEPLWIHGSCAAEWLGRGLDLVLDHDRPIARALDDSVVRLVEADQEGGRVVVLRAGRGLAPLSFPAPLWLAPKRPRRLALGGHLKNAVAVDAGDQLVVGEYIGDLDSPGNRLRHSQLATELPSLYRVSPAGLACDLHPDYASTLSAESLAAGRPIERVQHHLAHAWGALAAHVPTALKETWLVVAWDGTGLGDLHPGARPEIWGGEAFLILPSLECKRAATWRPFSLPGGDVAARQGWRAALGLVASHLGVAQSWTFLQEMPDHPLVTLSGPAARPVLNSAASAPLCSSVGRLFDAVAAAIGVCGHSHFEAEAAMRLEAIAAAEHSACISDGSDQIWPVQMNRVDGRLQLDWSPAAAAILLGPHPGQAAAFHRWLAQCVATLAVSLKAPRVLLTGGCFQNELLCRLTLQALKGAGVEGALPGRLAPGDGGLALGQLVAAGL